MGSKTPIIRLLSDPISRVWMAKPYPITFSGRVWVKVVYQNPFRVWTWYRGIQARDPTHPNSSTSLSTMKQDTSCLIAINTLSYSKILWLPIDHSCTPDNASTQAVASFFCSSFPKPKGTIGYRPFIMMDNWQCYYEISFSSPGTTN